MCYTIFFRIFIFDLPHFFDDCHPADQLVYLSTETALKSSNRSQCCHWWENWLLRIVAPLPFQL